MCIKTKETDKYDVIRFSSNSKRLDVTSKDGPERYTFYIYDRCVTHFSVPSKMAVPYEVAQLLRGLGYEFSRGIEIENPS